MFDVLKNQDDETFNIADSLPMLGAAIFSVTAALATAGVFNPTLFGLFNPGVLALMGFTPALLVLLLLFLS